MACRHTGRISAEHFRELLGVILETKNVNQFQLAQELGVGFSSITRWKSEGMTIRRAATLRRQLADDIRNGRM